MTIREMFKKLDAYNEIAEIRGQEPLRICFEWDYTHYVTSSYDWMRKYIKHEIIKELADEILTCKEWEFEQDHTIDWVRRDGAQETDTFQFYLTTMQDSGDFRYM